MPDASFPALDADRLAVADPGRLVATSTTHRALSDNALPLAGARDHSRPFWIAIDGAGVVGTAGIDIHDLPPLFVLSSCGRHGEREHGLHAPR